MFVFNVARALRLRGIEQHYKFLIKQGFAPFSARTMLEGNAFSIKFEHLERICLALNCTPNDLFEWHPAGRQPKRRRNAFDEQPAAKGFAANAPRGSDGKIGTHH